MDIEQRLVRLEHREELRELKHRYLMCADRHDVPGVKDCFSPDGAVIEFEGFPRCESRDEFAAMVAEFGGKPGFFTMHHGHNPCFEFTSDNEASGKWCLFFSAIDTNAATITEIGGVYHESYTRIDGRWYIQTSRFERQSFLMRGVEEGNLKAIMMGESTTA